MLPTVPLSTCYSIACQSKKTKTPSSSHTSKSLINVFAFPNSEPPSELDYKSI